MKNRLWKNWFLLLIGLGIMILPWMGFPQEFKNPLLVFAGFCVVVLSFVLARPVASDRMEPRQEELFRDSDFPEENDEN